MGEAKHNPRSRDKKVMGQVRQASAERKHMSPQTFSRRLLNLIPNAHILFDIGAAVVAMALGEKALNAPGRFYRPFRGAPQWGRGFGTARCKRAAAKHRAVVRARRLKHA